MLDDLLIHPRTLLQLNQFIAHPTHGLILVGPEGAGKRALAETMATLLLNLPNLTKLHNYPYYYPVSPIDNTITIEQIRGLEQVIKLKTPSADNKEIRRVLTIFDAGSMRHEAQNALLKNLEEPPADTVIIMTSESSGGLLPTIFSRMQKIDVLPVGEDQARKYYIDKGIASSDIASNYALSQGQAGLLNSLLIGESHPLKGAVELAKDLLSLPIGERLIRTEELSKDKQEITLLLNALGRISHAALLNAANAGNNVAVEKWRVSLASVQYAVSAMGHNANTKLVLDQILLSL